MIDNCLGVTAIGLGITWVGLLSTIVSAPAVIGTVVVMGLLQVIGSPAIKKLSLKIGKHEKIAMLSVSSLNTISSLISKAVSDDSISYEKYSLILLEFETFTRVKEDLREKSKLSLENSGNIETEANELLRRNKIGVLTWVHVQNRVKNRDRNRVRNSVRKRIHNRAQYCVQNCVQNRIQNRVQNRVQK